MVYRTAAYLAVMMVIFGWLLDTRRRWVRECGECLISAGKWIREASN